MRKLCARYRTRRPRRGFSLAELLVSIVILGLAMVALGNLYLAGMWTTHKARYLSVATQRAQYEMEKVQDLGLLNLLNGPSEESYPTTEYTHRLDGRGVSFNVESLPFGEGSVSWQNWPPNMKGNQYLLKVDIVINWEGPRSAASNVHVTTLVTNAR